MKHSDAKRIKTIDAFGKDNGEQILAPYELVSEVIAHLSTFKPPTRDYRSQIRKIEDEFLTSLAGEIIGNQLLDFHKQDGITEVVEWTEAKVVERRMNTALLMDEADQKIEICREVCFVGCVSNFTNFLDLGRKVLRQLEVGVPVCIMSRSNTSQHAYRWCQLLVDRMRAHDIDLGMVTFLSADL